MKLLTTLFVVSATIAVISAAPRWDNIREHELAEARDFAHGLASLESLDDEGLFSFWKKAKQAAKKAVEGVKHEAKVVEKAAGPIVKEAAKDAIRAKAGAVVIGVLG